MVKAYELRNKSKTELTETLASLKAELASLRVAQVTNQSSRLHLIKYIRKDIARVLTVANQTAKANLRELYKGKKFVPKELRPKLTRALRRKLTPEQAAKKTLRAKKLADNFPKRVFAVKSA